MEWIVLALVVGAVIAAVLIYNRLVTARNRYRNAFAQIDVQLTRRHDLIPNLVSVAQRYLDHERETLEAVTAARNQAEAQLDAARRAPGDTGAMQGLEGAESGLTAALGRLFAVAESYPELKADATMMQLSESLTNTENRVAFARQAYNDAVLGYNNLREVFPNNLLSGLFRFRPARLLTVDDPAKREAVQVAFN
ncbi:LemA family protein [Spiribacter halobius]|uniref:LemA family protein n=1 Tax=Sediminicurvatus halobius TaxID=2182432 RepID=A0A2U2N8H7_9GAMM|nr:LemA family protein [Spiribacter halobius]PWG65372.1 hypothetical protein DEM34_01080 [Spiribacter halobius]UEX76388.1 LemA family protein [Spiribacter halobius]